MTRCKAIAAAKQAAKDHFGSFIAVVEDDCEPGGYTVVPVEDLDLDDIVLVVFDSDGLPA